MPIEHKPAVRGGGKPSDDAQSEIPCVLPWKAFCLDDIRGEIIALPCCANWIKRHYGQARSRRFSCLWNGPGALAIREALVSGNQNAVCKRSCPYYGGGYFRESAVRVLPGTDLFERNQRENNAEIAQRQTRLKTRPVLFKMHTGFACNLRCRFCYQPHDAATANPRLMRLLEQNLPYLDEITWQGGEPLLSPMLRRFLRSGSFSDYPQLKVSLITNGVLLDEVWRRDLAGSPLKTLTVSLNAGDPSTYERLTGQGVFQAILSNVRALLRCAQANRRQFQLIFSCVLVDANLVSLPAFFALATDFNADVRLVLPSPSAHGRVLLSRKNYQVLRIVLEPIAHHSGPHAHEAWQTLQSLRLRESHPDEFMII